MKTRAATCGSRTKTPPPGGLTRWARADETFHRYSLTEDTSFLKDNFISTFGEDGSGQVWMGLWNGGLVRHRAGRFTPFTVNDGVPAGTITSIYRDGADRLWIASASGGAARIDDPAADRPRFVTYNRANGLASDSVSSIIEDREGRIYLGTGRGINRVDTKTGRIKHYTTADGLPENTIEGALRDRHDALWFFTRQGLARIVPEPDPPAVRPTILINGVRIAGVPWPVADVGQAAVTGIAVAADRNQFQINFVGIHFIPGETLRFQYQLDGARPGRQSTDQRTIHFAHLAPGAYRFQVWAVSTDGLASPSPATVAFVIHPPVWQRWWFLTLAGLTVGLLGYAGYRYRVARLLDLERVRTRIATDLHDDIGSSLSQMAILSEVTKQQIQAGHAGARDTATEIAQTARTLIEAMSDIVWSIDPRRDDLQSLVQRVRKFAADVLEGQGIAWSFQTPEHLERVKLTPEQRRHVFLILKEAVHNAARHAGATTVRLHLAVNDHHLTTDVQDNGRGFTPGATADPTKPLRTGYGLDSMRTRAEQLGGRLTIDTAPGRGTRISLRCSLP